MRIAFIHPFLYRYSRGIERFTFNVANAIVRRGAEVHLMTWRWRNPVEIDSLIDGVCVHEMPKARYYSAKMVIPFYVRHLLKQNYDFVWVFFAGYGEAEAITLASRFRRVPYGIVLHYPFEQVPHRYHEFKRHDFARRAQRLVSVSSFVADGAREFFGRESEIINNGVDLVNFKPDATRRARDRCSLNLTDDNQILLCVAALEERKGMQHIINALPKILAHHPQTKFVVTGEGEYRAELENLIARQGLQDVVKLVGSTADIYPYYNAADLFILLSHGEAAPVAPLEAMAMELPVIAANQRPFNEIVAPERGTLVNESDSDEVARVVNELLADDARRARMGCAGREYVKKNHTWDETAARYLNLAL